MIAIFVLNFSILKFDCIQQPKDILKQELTRIKQTRTQQHTCMYGSTSTPINNDEKPIYGNRHATGAKAVA